MASDVHTTPGRVDPTIILIGIQSQNPPKEYQVSGGTSESRRHGQSNHQRIIIIISYLVCCDGTTIPPTATARSIASRDFGIVVGNTVCVSIGETQDLEVAKISCSDLWLLPLDSQSPLEF
jgi:hypothetical protein